jgi:hypothetical protein
MKAEGYIKAPLRWQCFECETARSQRKGLHCGESYFNTFCHRLLQQSGYATILYPVAANKVGFTTVPIG